MALLVITLTWGLIRLAPGTFYSTEKKLPPAIEANIKKKYGLDQPIWKQYLLMLGNTTCRLKSEGEEVRGGLQFSLGSWNFKCFDFGDSLKYPDRSVNQIITDHLPYSATLGLLAYILALIVGLSAGIIAALRQNSAFDYASMTFAMLGLSIPNFVLGPVLVSIFSLTVSAGFRVWCCRSSRCRRFTWRISRG